MASFSFSSLDVCWGVVGAESGALEVVAEDGADAGVVAGVDVAAGVGTAGSSPLFVIIIFVFVVVPRVEPLDSRFVPRMASIYRERSRSRR